jgi:hypothetical protein
LSLLVDEVAGTLPVPGDLPHDEDDAAELCDGPGGRQSDDHCGVAHWSTTVWARTAERGCATATGGTFGPVKVMPKTQSELWLERYAAEHGLAGADDQHPDLGGDGHRPDYRLSRGQSAAIVEVKEFDSAYLDSALKSSGPRATLTLDPAQELESIRRRIRRASPTLRDHKARGEALIACLANPKGLWLDLGADDMQAAMHGDPGIRFVVDPKTGEQVGELWSEYGRNGAFADLHRHISGVMTIHRGTLAEEAVRQWEDENRHRWASMEDRIERGVAVLEARDDPALRAAEALEGDFHHVRVYESKWVVLGEAVPVPKDLFAGPRDQVWRIDPRWGEPVRTH